MGVIKMIKYLFLFLALVLIASQSAYTAKVDGLVLYLSFDDDSKDIIKDMSGNGNNGTNHGAKFVEGKYGKALQFNGLTTWVTVESVPELNFGPKESLTAMCWARITGAPSGQGNLLAKYAVGAGTTPFYGMFHNANNKVHAYIRDKNSKLVDPWSKDVINDDKWHHIALVRDTAKGKIYLYVDGNMDFEGNDITEDLSNDVPLAIGRHTGEFLNGIVDEAMVFRKALSQDEVKASMNPAKFLVVLTNSKLTSTWGAIKNIWRD